MPSDLSLGFSNPKSIVCFSQHDSVCLETRLEVKTWVSGAFDFGTPATQDTPHRPIKEVSVALQLNWVVLTWQGS